MSARSSRTTAGQKIPSSVAMSKSFCGNPDFQINAFAHGTKALDSLKEKWTDRMKGHIADYDIQCLPKDSLILIDDYLFNGLDEIDAHSEVSNCQSVI